MASDLCRSMACGEKQRKIIEMLPLQYNTLIIQERGINCIFQTKKLHAIDFRNIQEKLNCQEMHCFQRCPTAVRGRSSRYTWKPLGKIHSSLWLPSPGSVTVRRLKYPSPFSSAVGSIQTSFSRCKTNSAHRITSNTDPAMAEDSKTPNCPDSTAAHSTPWHCQGLFPPPEHYEDCVFTTDTLSVSSNLKTETL